MNILVNLRDHKKHATVAFLMISFLFLLHQTVQNPSQVSDSYRSTSSSRSMARTSPRPPTTRRWRPSALPRSPSWSRSCAEPRIPKLSAPVPTPRSQTSAPRLTSRSSTSWPLRPCLPLHPQWQSWRSIWFQRSKYQLKWAQILEQSWPWLKTYIQPGSIDEKCNIQKSTENCI